MHRQVIRAKQVTTGYVGDSKMALPENGRKLYHCRHQRSLQVTESHLRLSAGVISVLAVQQPAISFQSQPVVRWHQGSRTTGSTSCTICSPAIATKLCLSFLGIQLHWVLGDLAIACFSWWLLGVSHSRWCKTFGLRISHLHVTWIPLLL